MGCITEVACNRRVRHSFIKGYTILPSQHSTYQYSHHPPVCSCTVRLTCVCGQVRLYQLMRLIHDHYKDLYNHFEEHEIAPALYATPWFLTLFASQFTLGFVARVFGEASLFCTMCVWCKPSQ